MISPICTDFCPHYNFLSKTQGFLISFPSQRDLQ
jgi:hypothetical protein